MSGDTEEAVDGECPVCRAPLYTATPVGKGKSAKVWRSEHQPGGPACRRSMADAIRANEDLVRVGSNEAEALAIFGFPVRYLVATGRAPTISGSRARVPVSSMDSLARQAVKQNARGVSPHVPRWAWAVLQVGDPGTVGVGRLVSWALEYGREDADFAAIVVVTVTLAEDEAVPALQKFLADTRAATPGAEETGRPKWKPTQ